jgi:hypothetical protein
MTTSEDRLITISVPLIDLPTGVYQYAGGDGVLDGVPIRFRSSVTGGPAVPLAAWWWPLPDSPAHQQVLGDLGETLAGMSPRVIDLGAPVLEGGQVLLPVTSPAAVADLRDAVTAVLDQHAAVVVDPVIAQSYVGWLGYDLTVDGAGRWTTRIPGWQHRHVNGTASRSIAPVRGLPIPCLDIHDHIPGDPYPTRTLHDIKCPLDPVPAGVQPRTLDLGARTLSLHSGRPGERGSARVQIRCHICQDATGLTLNEHDLRVWITCIHGHISHDERVTAYVVDQAHQQIHDDPEINHLHTKATPDTHGFFM